MPLEACPVCGYAVSTETGRCRHCATERALRSAHFNWMNALAFAVAIGCVIYVLFFR
jgi:RNA polymerase subunit RPABC4/transcription elongation factor Spt4